MSARPHSHTAAYLCRFKLSALPSCGGSKMKSTLTCPPSSTVPYRMPPRLMLKFRAPDSRVKKAEGRSWGNSWGFLQLICSQNHS